MRACFRPALVLVAAVALAGNTPNPEGGVHGLNHAQTDSLTREYDQQLTYALETLIASAEIDRDGKVYLNRPVGDRRFLEPNSGYYWQISGNGQDYFPSRSLWDRRLKVSGAKAATEPFYCNSDQFPDEPLRIVMRTIRLPGSDIEWQFVVARVRDGEAS